jgi:hypothetical protein
LFCAARQPLFYYLAPPLIVVELLAAGNGTIAKLSQVRKEARCTRATYSLRIFTV